MAAQSVIYITDRTFHVIADYTQILNFENGFPSLHANHSRQLDRKYTMVKPVRQQDLDFMKVEHGWWEAERIAQTHQRVQVCLTWTY